MNKAGVQSPDSQQILPQSGAGLLRRLGRFAGVISLILLVWFCMLAAVPVIRDGPGQYLVIGPQGERLEGIAATQAKLVSEGWGYTQIDSRSPDIVSQLYANGIWLVLPASNGGCLSLTNWQRLNE